MNMFTESLILSDLKSQKEDKLDCLFEYLVLSEGIALTEAKQLLHEAKKQAVEEVKKAKSYLQTQLAAADKQFEISMKKAGKDATKIQQAKIKLARARDVAQAYYRSALKAISQKYGQVRDVVKSAVMKGKEEMPLPTKGKGGKMVSAGIWNKTNKLGKAGIVGGGAAAAAGLGYAGFRAFKKKKQAA